MKNTYLKTEERYFTSELFQLFVIKKKMKEEIACYCRLVSVPPSTCMN